MKATYQVIAQYAIGSFEQGQVISAHKSYALARKDAKRIGDHFTAIRIA